MSKIITTSDGGKFIVDEDIYEFISSFTWRTHNGKYAIRTVAEKTESGRKFRAVFMHRLIAETPDGLFCDHINLNTFDNRKSNLRNITRRQNQINTKDRKNKTGHRGVRELRSGYVGYGYVNGKIITGRTRKTIEEAIQDRKRIEEENGYIF